MAEGTKFGTGGGNDVFASADCDAGDNLLGVGGNAPGDGDQVTFSSPFVEGGQGLGLRDDRQRRPSVVDAFALCADFPPQH